MGSIDYLLQGLDKNKDHLGEIDKLFELKNIKGVFLSVAYVREQGIDLIEKMILPYKDKIRFFIGIRNGVTSKQALKRLIRHKIFPIVVDTASTTTIFHPKIFLAYSDEKAKIIIGSANLTAGGLVRNIEASTVIELNLKVKEDKEYLKKLLETFEELEKSHPQNIFKVTSNAQISKLFEEGRLNDELKIVTPNITGKKNKSKTEDIVKIKLNTRSIKPSISSKKIKTKKVRKAKKVSHKEESAWYLLWESKPLTERDLNIPSGGNTNPTGSMLLKQGNIENIDQRHYFREVIFSDLDWHLDETPSKSHLERTSAEFQIIVKGISFGIFRLRLTHNTRTDTRSYQQSNAMTQLHWGEAKEIIAKRHLLGCTLRLYKPINEEDAFIIDIE